jgi:hypothetical protein
MPPRRLVLKWNLNTGRRSRYEKLRTFGSSRSFLQAPQRIPEPAIDHAAAPRRIDVPHSVDPLADKGVTARLPADAGAFKALPAVHG